MNEDSFRLIHLSTRDYLRSSPVIVGLTEPVSQFLVDVPLTQKRIALTCLEYLSSSGVTKSPDFPSAIDRAAANRRQEIADISARISLFE